MDPQAQVKQLLEMNEEAVRRFSQGDLAGAAQLFEKLVAYIPDNSSFRNNLGTVYWSLGKTKEAISTLSQGYMYNPGDLQTGVNLLKAYTHLEAYDAARAIANVLQKQNSEDLALKQTIAELMMAIDKSAKSVAPIKFKPKILFIAEPASIHSARWINQFSDLGWDVHITSGEPITSFMRPEFKIGTLHAFKQIAVPASVRYSAFPELTPGNEVNALKCLIEKIQPDFIHSLGLCVNWTDRCLPVAKALKLIDPQKHYPWIYSSWGTDLDYFAQHRTELGKIRESLERVDYYFSECSRDLRLAQEMGFQGKFLGYLPVFGGVTWGIEHCQEILPSKRKSIIIKGRDAADGDFIGRAVTVMGALLGSIDACRDYEIILLQAGPTVSRLADGLKNQFGINIQTHSAGLGHKETLDFMGKARVMLSFTINDGLPSFLVEALSLGVFPIHSDLDSIREWIIPGTNGFLVGHDDVPSAAQALRRALLDDKLVDDAAFYNYHYVRTHWSFEHVKNKTIEAYREVLGLSHR